MADKINMREQDRQNRLLKIFLEVTGESLLSVADVREIVQTGYEIFKKNKTIRGGLFNGTYNGKAESKNKKGR